MVTPQTNTTLEQMAKRFKDFETFAICGHVSPDGDCLGSQLALAHALRSLGKKVTCLLAKPDPIEHNLLFLPGVEDMVVGSEFNEAVDVFIAVDVPTTKRLETAAAAQKRAGVRFTIDHHAVDSCMSEYNYVDPDAPSASMLIWEVAKYLGVENNEKVALCALTGLMTDTGRFSYQNTTAEAFVAAAEMVHAGASPSLITKEFFQNRSRASLKLEQIMLERMDLRASGEFAFSYLKYSDFKENNAIKADAEVLIDILRDIAGVRVALILREQEDGTVRGSLRAKDDTDVAQIARKYDGGGHKAAAGFTYYQPLDSALVELPQCVLSTCFSEMSA